MLNNNDSYVICLSPHLHVMLSTIKRSDGPYSAESYRDDVLIPALQRYSRVRILIDGGAYSMAYLEEIFGGIIKAGHFRLADLDRRLEIAPSIGYKYTRLAIMRFMHQAELRRLAEYNK